MCVCACLHTYICVCVCVYIYVCMCVINLWNEERIHLYANQWRVWENKF